MKKLLVIFAALFCLMACSKDGIPTKNLYHNSTAIDGVAYELNIYKEGEEYNWVASNKTEEVSIKYTFNYDRKSDLQKDFADLAEGVENFDADLVPAFSADLRFLNDEEHEALIYREVVGGNVFVKFILGTKTFRLPYDFIMGANDVLNPKE